MLHLDDATISDLLSPADAARMVRLAFTEWGHGRAATTQRARAVAPDGMASAMAAVVPPFCGGKVYATWDGRFTFLNVLFHVDGTLLATLDGDTLTRLRTPAVSTLAIAHLASPGAHVAAVIGAGRQGWGHVEMLAAQLPGLTELRICGRPGTSNAALLAQRARRAGIPARAHDDPAAAVDGAHVLVTVTSSTAPLFPASAVADDALICSVGATKPDRAELGADLVERCAAVVCDDLEGSKAECGDLIQAAAAGRFDWSRAVELHALAAGTARAPRAGPAPVLFETQGVAIQDVALAGLAWQRAVEQRGEHAPPADRNPHVPTLTTRPGALP